MTRIPCKHKFPREFMEFFVASVNHFVECCKVSIHKSESQSCCFVIIVIVFRLLLVNRFSLGTKRWRKGKAHCCSAFVTLRDSLRVSRWNCWDHTIKPRIPDPAEVVWMFPKQPLRDFFTRMTMSMPTSCLDTSWVGHCQLPKWFLWW